MLTSRIASLLLLLTMFCLPARAENWPQFRGPAGDGHSTAKGLPIHWDTEQNVAWKVKIPGLGWSSPIIQDGKLYLTAAVPVGKDGADQSLRTLCLNPQNGETIWDTEVFLQPGPTKIHSKNSHASPTPITDGKRLFVHFGTNGTACLDLKGEVLWRNTDLKYDPVHGSGGSPVLVDQNLIFSCDGSDLQFVTALDASTGKVRWKTERDSADGKKFSFSTPLVLRLNGKTQIVSPGSNCVNSYDAADGHEIWKVRYDGYSVIPCPIFGHGLIFVCTGYNSPSLYAIRPDGEGDVTDTHVEWKLSKAVPHSPSLILVDAELYLVSDQGIATCLEAKTGEQYWQKRLGGNYSASPIAAEGRIYFQSEQGEGIVLQAGQEFAELARNPLGERSLASYAAGDRTLFIRTEGHLYCVKEK